MLVGLLKYLGDVATVLDLFSQFVLFLYSDELDDDEIRSLSGALAVFRLLVDTNISLDYYY